MRGFSLVEVMIAALVIMLGVTGYVTLQSEYVRSDAETNLRQIAIKLAQEKLDDLRRFDAIKSAAGVIAYNDISDDLGGSIAAGNVDITIASDDRTYQFAQNWTAVDEYFVDTDADGAPDTWLEQGDPGLPLDLPEVPSQKTITVSVNWADVEGNTKTVSVDSSLAPVPVERSFQAITETNNAKLNPHVRYQPELAPDVIAYDLGNGERVETSKPVPEIYNKGDNNIVQFETVKYVTDPDGTEKLEQDDFLTVNCSCQLAGTGAGYTPSMAVLVDGELVVQPGQEKSKTIGKIADTKQPALCTQCCRDHHDTAEMLISEQYYRSEGGLPHGHYQYQGDGSFVKASSVGDPYDEICRFKRVDGLFELYPDWQLVDIIEFDDNYLLDGAVKKNYLTYSESVVKATILGMTPPSKPSDRDISIVPGGKQLIARGIYLDRMTSVHLTELKRRLASGDSDWKAIAPFYDINLTLLANWKSSNETVAKITQDAIETIVDPASNYYGTYSRGRVEALIDGTADMTVTGFPYNASITGTSPISGYEKSLVKVDDSLMVTVDSKSASEKFYALIGNINCVITISGVTSECEAHNDKTSTYVDLSAISMIISPSNFICPITIPKGKSTSFFSCTNVSENWTGYIQFSLIKSGYLVAYQIEQPDGTVISTDKITLSSGLDSTSNQEYNLVISMTKL